MIAIVIVKLALILTSGLSSYVFLFAIMNEFIGKNAVGQYYVRKEKCTILSILVFVVWLIFLCLLLGITAEVLYSL